MYGPAVTHGRATLRGSHVANGPAATDAPSAGLQHSGTAHNPARSRARGALHGAEVTDSPPTANARITLQRGRVASRPARAGARAALKRGEVTSQLSGTGARTVLQHDGTTDNPAAVDARAALQRGGVADRPAATNAWAALRGGGVRGRPAATDANTAALQSGGAERGSSRGMGGDLKVHEAKHAFGPFVSSCIPGRWCVRGQCEDGRLLPRNTAPSGDPCLFPCT